MIGSRRKVSRRKFPRDARPTKKPSTANYALDYDIADGEIAPNYRSKGQQKNVQQHRGFVNPLTAKKRRSQYAEESDSEWVIDHKQNQCRTLPLRLLSGAGSEHASGLSSLAG